MSRVDPSATNTRALLSSDSQKRKRPTSTRGSPSDGLGLVPSPSDGSAAAAHHGSHKRRRISDELSNHSNANGYPVDGTPSAGAVGSASSASTTSSIFSHQGNSTMPSNGGTAQLFNHTPLTANDSSPPERAHSPKPVDHHGLSNGHPSQHASPLGHESRETAQARIERPRARPDPGQQKGERIIYDPETDPKMRKAPREQRPKVRYRPFGQSESLVSTPDPRLAIPGYRDGDLGSFSGAAKVWKQKLRHAPYMIPAYTWDNNISIGAGPPSAVVVTGFDPFTQDGQLRMLFSSYGDIAVLENKIDPNTGTKLGICWIRYKDGVISHGGRPAIDAARKAESDGTGQRVGVHTVRVERDRVGKKCKRYVDNVSRRNQERRMREAKAEEAKRGSKPALTGSTGTPRTPDVSAPPPNAPKGPSGKTAMRPPEGPKAVTAKTAAQSLIEPEPILSSIKRKPYAFIPGSSVPVMGTTIPHLKKRMKAYDWREVRCDETGYFVIFDDSKRGEEEAVRCHTEMNGKPMFTYTLQMECQQYGNPNYERSPSPERAAAIKRQHDEEERKARDAEQDWEEERKSRAENLDPAAAASEQLRIELLEKIVGDIKGKVVAQALFEYLEPSRHASKRNDLGIADPVERMQAPTLLLAGDLGSHGRNAFRMQDGRRQALHNRGPRPGLNAFIDERRQKSAKRRPEPMSLHHRLLALHGDDSDDEEKASSRDDIKGDDSRSMSRLSSMAPDGDVSARGRRKLVDRDDSVREDESGEEDLGIARKLLDPHMLKKEPEDMATAELQQVINSLPISTRLHKQATKELKIRQRNQDDDQLFRHLGADDIAPSVEALTEDPLASSTDALVQKLVKQKKESKSKKKSKKQIFEEREAAKAAAMSAKALLKEETAPTPEARTAEEDLAAKDEFEEVAEEEERAEVEWGVSTDVPRRTVEDDPDLFMDIDGWQHIVKDEEDFKFLKLALKSVEPANIGNVSAWALRQKEIKRLNTQGEGSSDAAVITGYYVPNASGSARTEGFKKILESEKSQYLPHRLKVAADRERRQQEKSNPTVNTEALKKAKLASTANSRSSRANNRTQMRDINTAKQNLIMDGQQGDAIRFNALKKRKKKVKFERSAIHGWGLYADENIALGDMIIEYVGEKVRQAVANIREIRYDKQGMGSSYLFRIDDDTVVDATKKGGIARFINHSCAPNCTAKIIKVDGTKRIVIYALKEITKDEELTYDYKFDRELDNNDRIPCLCGSEVCKGFLN